MTNKAVLFTVSPDSEYTGVMLALFPSPQVAEQIATMDGVTMPAEQMHVTLAYAGSLDMLTDLQVAGAIVAAQKVATYSEPLTGTINGMGRFNASQSSDGQDVIYAVIDMPGLDELRNRLGECLKDHGIEPSGMHGYTPHMTLAYIAPGAESPVATMPTTAMQFNAISVAVGDKRVDYPTMSMEEPFGDYHKNGNALKAVSRTDTELRVANYMVLFGGRDLEGIASKRKNADGSAGEYFTKTTSFESDYTQTGVVYVDWEHSSGREGAGEDDILGYVDWKTARIDDKGVLVERVLNRRNRYVQFVDELISAGLIGNSTEAVPDSVEKAANGRIAKWPLRRDTLTVTPMEPRMLSQNAIAAIKGLSEKYPALKALLDTPDTSQRNNSGKGAENARQREIAKRLRLLALLELESTVRSNHNESTRTTRPGAG